MNCIDEENERTKRRREELDKHRERVREKNEVAKGQIGWKGRKSRKKTKSDCPWRKRREMCVCVVVHAVYVHLKALSVISSPLVCSPRREGVHREKKQVLTISP